jgi:hypothetical protein
MKVACAGVMAVRYIGVQPKKLWEVGGFNVPILQRGDIVIVGELVGLSLSRGRFFEKVVAEVSIDVKPLEKIEEPKGDNPPADSEVKDELSIKGLLKKVGL